MRIVALKFLVGYSSCDSAVLTGRLKTVTFRWPTRTMRIRWYQYNIIPMILRYGLRRWTTQEIRNYVANRGQGRRRVRPDKVYWSLQPLRFNGGEAEKGRKLHMGWKRFPSTAAVCTCYSLVRLRVCMHSIRPWKRVVSPNNRHARVYGGHCIRLPEMSDRLTVIFTRRATRVGEVSDGMRFHSAKLSEWTSLELARTPSPFSTVPRSAYTRRVYGKKSRWVPFYPEDGHSASDPRGREPVFGLSSVSKGLTLRWKKKRLIDV